MYALGDKIDGEYVVSAVFTNGGMGVVYKVHHLGWQIDMAMKCPRPEFFKNEEQKQNFAHECETWMDLGVHPNIVACYYVKQIHTVPSVLMEYMEGGSLSGLIHSHKLYAGNPHEVLARIIDIAIQTTRGLAYAHNKGFVHQDVKPANVLLSIDGIAKVSDFGLSKAKSHLSQATLSNDNRSIIVSSGGYTPAYCSPEQAMGWTLTRRTDIWSWATMVLEMVHGSIFWRIGPAAAPALRQIQRQNIFNSAVEPSGNLLALLTECLTEDEKGRPRDFEIIGTRLLAIYEKTFLKQYPRRLPPQIVLSESTLCNRIASYAELSKGGTDHSSKIYECVDELRRTAPWSIWGELNYAVYSQQGGVGWARILTLLENQLVLANSSTAKAWMVDILLNLGATSPTNRFYKKLGLIDEPILYQKVHYRLETMRERLLEFFAPEAWHPAEPGQQSGRARYPKSKGVSQNGQCSVQVVQLMAQAKIDPDIRIQVKVELRSSTGTKCFVAETELPEGTSIEFVTVDDNAIKVSLWIKIPDCGMHQKVLRVIGGKLIPYCDDFRHYEGWDSPSAIYVSGDTKTMLLLYGKSICSVWYKDEVNDKDGRNICLVDLCEYGLIPENKVLPGFRLDRAFEYLITEETAYKLMALLVELYGRRVPPYYITLPNHSMKEIEHALRGEQLLVAAKTARENGENRREVALLAACCELGILPDDPTLARRHLIANSFPDKYLSKVWRYSTINEYWNGEMLMLIPEDGKFAIASLNRGPRICIPAGKVKITTHYPNIQSDEFDRSLTYQASIKEFENGDILTAFIGKHYQDTTQIFRYKISIDGRVVIKWEHTFPTKLFFRNYEIVLDQDFISICNSDIGLQILDLATGDVIKSIDTLKYIVYQKMGFQTKCPIRLIATSSEGTLVFDREFNLINRIGIVPVSSLTFRYDMVGISGDASKILMSSEFNVNILDTGTGKTKIIYSSTINRGESPFTERCCECAISENGGAVALITFGGFLLVFDSESSRLVFKWKLELHVGRYNIYFDKSDRWLVILHDHNILDVFQLFWDVGEP